MWSFFSVFCFCHSVFVMTQSVLSFCDMSVFSGILSDVSVVFK